MWEYNNLDELYHHGILGMHWGVRRYQNKDGSLTRKGKEKRMSQDAKDLAKLKKKKVREMSNEELKRYNNRRNLENNYYENKKKAVLGTKVLLGVGTAALIASNYGTLRDNGQKMIKDGKDIVKFVKSKLS